MTLPDKLFTETCVFFHFRGFRTLAISQGKMALSSSENEVWLGGGIEPPTRFKPIFGGHGWSFPWGNGH
jgi:hypothetical protein